MCTVQVLLLTDLMGRPGSYGMRPSPVPPRNICRRLFVDDDSEPRPSRLLGALEADMEKKVREKWNFDFRTGTPLPGRFQWVPVRPGSRLPRTVDSVTVDVMPQTTTSAVVEEVRPRPLSTIQAKSISRTTTVKTQSKITDFLLQRKRHRPIESDLSCPKLKSRRLDTTTSTVN